MLFFDDSWRLCWDGWHPGARGSSNANMLTPRDTFQMIGRPSKPSLPTIKNWESYANPFFPTSSTWLQPISTTKKSTQQEVLLEKVMILLGWNPLEVSKYYFFQLTLIKVNEMLGSDDTTHPKNQPSSWKTLMNLRHQWFAKWVSLYLHHFPMKIESVWNRLLAIILHVVWPQPPIFVHLLVKRRVPLDAISPELLANEDDLPKFSSCHPSGSGKCRVPAFFCYRWYCMFEGWYQTKKRTKKNTCSTHVRGWRFCKQLQRTAT